MSLGGFGDKSTTRQPATDELHLSATGLITLEFPNTFILGSYVQNSGDKFGVSSQVSNAPSARINTHDSPPSTSTSAQRGTRISLLISAPWTRASPSSGSATSTSCVRTKSAVGGPMIWKGALLRGEITAVLIWRSVRHMRRCSSEGRVSRLGAKRGSPPSCLPTPCLLTRGEGT